MGAIPEAGLPSPGWWTRGRDQLIPGPLDGRARMHQDSWGHAGPGAGGQAAWSHLLTRLHLPAASTLTLSTFHHRRNVSRETRTRGAVSPRPGAGGRLGGARSQGRLEGEAGGLPSGLGRPQPWTARGPALGHHHLRPVVTLSSGWWGRVSTTLPAGVAGLTVLEGPPERGDEAPIPPSRRTNGLLRADTKESSQNE